MNISLKQILTSNENERFRYFDTLLENKMITITELEDYYINNISMDTIAFAKRYSKYIDELSLLRRKIKKLEKVKELLLNKYF